MRKTILRATVIMTVAASLGLQGCIGSFSLTNRLLSWNRNVGNKIVNELVFFAFWVLPVYEVAALADMIVINSIEFWSGDNPLAQGTRKIEGSDGQIYLVKCDGKGYDIVSQNDGSKVRLDFTPADSRWDVTLPSGQKYELMTIVDANHVSLPAPDGGRMVVSTDAHGLMAYRQMANGTFLAQF